MNTYINDLLDLLDTPNHNLTLAIDPPPLWEFKETILYRIQKEKTTSTCPNCGAPLNGNNICEYCKTRFYQ